MSRKPTDLGTFIRNLVDLAEDEDKRRQLETKVKDLGERFVRTLEDPHTIANIMVAAGKHKAEVREVRRRRSRR